MARINQAIANETWRLGPNIPIVNQANPLETPAGTIMTAKHQISRKPYVGVAVFWLQKHFEYFFNINRLGYPFSRLCFINKPKTPVSTIEGGHPELSTIWTRNTIDIDDGRPSDFLLTSVPNFKRGLTKNVNSDGIRWELTAKNEQRTQYAILIL